MAKQRVIGIVNPDMAGSFAASLLEGIYNLAHQRGFDVVACKGSVASVWGKGFARSHVDGWIIFEHQVERPKIQLPRQPVVAVSMATWSELVPVILPDNRRAIQAVMQHLFAHGHERIAFIGTLNNSDIQQRLDSYRDAMSERGLLDPQLVVDTRGYFEEQGRAAIQSLLAAGAKFTAVVAAGDFNALGAIEALGVAGKRVPEDVAITGFDDVQSAQFANPPLSTIRQRPDVMGELALQTLLRMIEGEEVGPGEVLMPTALIQRRSCGCDNIQPLITPDLGALVGAGWRDTLAAQLALLAQYPLPLDGRAPGEIWPGAPWLSEQLEVVVQGGALPETRLIEQAWREVLSITESLDILYAMINLFEGAAQMQLSSRPAAEPRNLLVQRFVDQVRMAMMRTRLDHEEIATDVLNEMARAYEAIDGELLGTRPLTPESLSWLNQTPAMWACLAMWEHETGTPPRLRVTHAYHRHGQETVPLGSIWQPEEFPPAQMLRLIPDGKLAYSVALLPVSSDAQEWGMLALCLPSHKQITYDMYGLNLLAPRLAARLDRSTLVASLREERETVQQLYERERALARTVRELGCPIIPLLEGVLLVPLIGGIDEDRAQEILQTVLDGIQRYNATAVLLDITGVALVDTQVANSLLQMTRAARLLGARPILVGVRPEIAQSIVGLGIDLSLIETFPALASALATLGKSPLRR